MALVKGICKNFGECDLADNKEVQEVEKTNFVCEECGKPLHPLESAKASKGKGFNKKNAYIIGGGVAAAVIIAGGIFAFSGGNNEAPEPVPVVTGTEPEPIEVDSESVKVEPEPIKVEPEPVVKPQDPGITPKTTPKNPSWGKYEGARDASGLPHGNGILRITRSTTINGETAQPGERIEGVFRNGYLNMGTWYKNDGNVVVVKDVRVL